jgi:hypothetical protein
MHVIITGGTGLIGRHLAQDLAADGHRVSILTRHPEKHQGLSGQIQLIGWDAKTTEGWAQLVDEADAVVNLTGAGIADARWTPARKQLIRDSRVDAGQALVAAIRAAQSKPRVLIQASAVGYYGPCGDELITEESPPGKDFLAQVCVQWEASTAPVEDMGVRRAIIRTGIVLSQQGGALPRMLLPFKLFVGGPLGNGKQYFPWIHIQDEVRAIRFLLELDQASGAYNLTAPNPPTNAEFSRALGKVLGRPAFLPTPALALKILFGEMATVLLDGQRAVPERLLQQGFSFRFTEAEEALRDILK